jgi:hypothetical protein
MPVLRRTSLGSRLFVGSHGEDGRWDNDYGRDDHSKKERDSVPTGQTKRQEIGKKKRNSGKDYFLSLACCIGEYGAKQLMKHVTIKVLYHRENEERASVSTTIQSQRRTVF